MKQRFDVAKLVQSRDHRKHHADLAECRGAEDRPELGAQDLGTSEANPHPALAKEGIVLLGNRQIGERLVAADVERPDDEWAPRPHRFRDGLVGFELLLFRRRIASSQEEELRAQQPYAFTAEPGDPDGVLESADVCENLYALAIESDRRFERTGGVLPTAALRTLLRAVDAREVFGRGMQPQRPVVGVEDDGSPVWNLEHGRVDARPRRGFAR